jgi:hypothetical protein
MTTPQDPSRLVGRSVTLQLDHGRVASTVVAVGTGGVVLDVEGKRHRVEPWELNRLDLPG